MTTVNWELVKKLNLLGLEDNEARIYLVSLELGPSSIWQIHQQSHIKRTTCYQIFDNFITRGIGAKTPGEKHAIYSVVTPENLIISLEQKKDIFRQSLPLFEAIASKSDKKPEIKIFKGLEGVRQAYYLGLNQPEGGEKLICGGARIWIENKEANDAYIAERLRKKISLRIIFSDEKINRTYVHEYKNNENLREIRFLPEKIYNPPIETQICGNMVIYIAHSEREPFATVIENSAIALAEKQKFELLWQIAKA